MPQYTLGYRPVMLYNPEVISAIRQLPGDDVVSDDIKEVELPDLGSAFWPYY